MSEQDTNFAGRLLPVLTTAPTGRTLIGIASIAGMLCIVVFEAFGYRNLLPMVAALLVAGGFAIASIAWLSGARRHDTEVTSWDLAGSLTLWGRLVAAMSN